MVQVYIGKFIGREAKLLAREGAQQFTDAIERQLVAPFGLNYHAEHHMFPGVPYHALPGLAARVAAHPGVEVRKSYLAFLVTLARRVPLAAAEHAVPPC